MKPFQRIPFFIRLLNWEYWPFTVHYFPMFVYWFVLGFRARALFFFSAANPGIPTGGFAGESKEDIMGLIPEKWKPSSFLMPLGLSEQEVIAGLKEAEIQFPAFAKPDVGERGMLVRKVANLDELKAFQLAHPVTFQIQEYIDYPVELSILHYRFPEAKKGNISSVTLKEYLNVVGDGRSTVEELIRAYPRARLQLDDLRQTHKTQFREVLKDGEVLIFHTIGNHNKGCKFMNGNHLVTVKLISIFDCVNDNLEGINYCRYDIKCASWEALEANDFKILEINGAKSEPAHIYHPGYSIRQFYKDIFWHWTTLMQISMANNALGVPYLKASEAFSRLGALRAYHKEANA